MCYKKKKKKVRLVMYLVPFLTDLNKSVNKLHYYIKTILSNYLNIMKNELCFQDKT